jgi:hypothetical protein
MNSSLNGQRRSLIIRQLDAIRDQLWQEPESPLPVSSRLDRLETMIEQLVYLLDAITEDQE